MILNSDSLNDDTKYSISNDTVPPFHPLLPTQPQTQILLLSSHPHNSVAVIRQT